jgi:hypothetical protein
MTTPRHLNLGVAPRRWRGIAIALLAPLLLVACQGNPPSGGNAAWTYADLGSIFDLSELGAALTIDAETSTLMLDGRPLPADVLESFPHLTMGRSYNLLRLSEDALDAMASEARQSLVHASPSELRAYLDDHALTMEDVRAAWGSDGELTLLDLQRVAAALDAQSEGLGTASSRGQRLLDTLGIAR